jgi:Raf kinase inhibitor-like YbhB/YbcL family protein
MKKTLLFTSFLCLSAQAHALEVKAPQIENGKPIDEKFAFCKPSEDGKTKPGGNVNPEIKWSGAPAATKSFAVIMVDPDVPAKFDDANQIGKTIAKNFPRQDFYHWVVVDIPASQKRLEEAQDSSGHQDGGKPVGKRAYGVVGKNDYATFMKGRFGGYDGPCPPWNDDRVHNYHFKVFALDVASLGLSGEFTGKEAMAQIKKHTLASGETMGTFTNKAGGQVKE